MPNQANISLLVSGEEPRVMPCDATGTPLDTSDYDALSEIVETNVRGLHVVSIIAMTYGESSLDSVFFEIQLWKLDEWCSIEDTTYPTGAPLDAFTTIDLAVAYEIAFATIRALIGDDISI